MPLNSKTLLIYSFDFQFGLRLLENNNNKELNIQYTIEVINMSVVLCFHFKLHLD